MVIVSLTEVEIMVLLIRHSSLILDFKIFF